MIKALPESVEYYAQTPLFDETGVPAKLTSLHDTKPGVWGKLVVISGALDYILAGPPETQQRVIEGEFAIIEPTIPHRVAIDRTVRFRVEFYR